FHNSHTMPKEAPARRQVRLGIRDITLDIKYPELNEFDLHNLERFNIHVNFMSLDKSSDNLPSFFAPCPKDSFPDPSEEALGGSYNGIDDKTELSLTRSSSRAYILNNYLSNYIHNCDITMNGPEFPWTSKEDKEYPFPGLYKYTPPEFGCYSATYLEGPDHPHVKTIMYNNRIATDSTILTSKLIPILRIMLVQLLKVRFIHHMVTPVRTKSPIAAGPIREIFNNSLLT
ncbi:hypothetical protein ARAM_003634, partial [Aspergillus rambellii]